MGRFSLGLLLVATALLAVSSTTENRLLLILITSTAIYFGYRLQLGSNEAP